VSAANVESDGTVTSLDGRAEPSTLITEEDAKDPQKVARILTEVLGQVASQRRRWAPRRIVFRDIAVTGDAVTPVTVQLEHGFGGRVSWWPVDWVTTSTVTLGIKQNTTTTTADTLGLWFFCTGTISICVEEAG
jgi:hypothetical protein